LRYSSLISWCEIRRFFCVHQNKNCGQIKPDTTDGRTEYKLKAAYMSNPKWRGIRYCHFCVKWMAYVVFIVIILFFMQLLCLPSEVLSLTARLQRVPVQRDKWSF
jgi:hypothetical protein